RYYIRLEKCHIRCLPLRADVAHNTCRHVSCDRTGGGSDLVGFDMRAPGVGKKVGRNRMSRAVAFFAALLASVIVAIPAGAAEFGTRDEATAMVRRVQQKFKKEGPEATFRAINNKEPGFADRDLYPFVTE